MKSSDVSLVEELINEKLSKIPNNFSQELSDYIDKNYQIAKCFELLIPYYNIKTLIKCLKVVTTFKSFIIIEKKLIISQDIVYDIIRKNCIDSDLLKYLIDNYNIDISLLSFSRYQYDLIDKFLIEKEQNELLKKIINYVEKVF